MEVAFEKIRLPRGEEDLPILLEINDSRRPSNLLLLINNIRLRVHFILLLEKGTFMQKKELDTIRLLEVKVKSCQEIMP